MAVKLTKKQKQIVDYISTFLEENDYSPSYREIMSGLGLSSVSAVAEHIDNLISKGVLKKTPGTPRSLEVTIETYPETTALFNNAIATSDSEEDTDILKKAASILGIELDPLS